MSNEQLTTKDLSCALPSLAVLSWEAFERQGLTRKVQSYNTWEDGIAAAVRDMGKLLDQISDVVALKRRVADAGGERGATWLL